jgi:hypothetical protein
MNIEEGKFYRSNDGRKVGPISPAMYPNGDFRWTAPQGGPYLWQASGVYGDNRDENLDLVAEWLDGPVRLVTSKVIVPGIYGRVYVGTSYDDNLRNIGITREGEGGAHFASAMRSDELRAAATVLTEIADAMDGAE